MFFQTFHIVKYGFKSRIRDIFPTQFAVSGEE